MNPLIDQLAADVRERLGAQLPAARKVARQIAADFRRDLPDIPDEVIGAVLLRAMSFAKNQFVADPSTTAGTVANALGAAGERLFHHPEARDEASADPDCEEC